MNNGNQSAGVLPSEFCGEGTDCTGLTKREVIAMNVMSGFAADTGLESAYKEDIARLAVSWADALLAELNK